jgi:hypothetical protein
VRLIGMSVCDSDVFELTPVTMIVSARDATQYLFGGLGHMERLGRHRLILSEVRSTVVLLKKRISS